VGSWHLVKAQILQTANRQLQTEQMEYREENNYPKAFLATGIILGLLMALCYFIVFLPPPKLDEGTGGILVNYGTTDQGMGTDYMSTEQPSVAEKANHVKPDKLTPTPPSEKVQADNSDKKILTQNNEDAPEVATSKKKATANVAAPATKSVAKPLVNQAALYKGKANGGTGAGDGATNTPGNQGKPNGSTLTNNYNGTGSGNGGSLDLKQRSFISKPSVSDDNRSMGKIVIQIHVDKSGNIIQAEVFRGTTISDNNLIDKCINAVKNSKINALETAPDTQIGEVTFVFRVN
jgi:outer membrane biosynthesis protein TonB